MSLPYPEPGIRLIRQDRIDGFTAQMREFQDELAEAVSNLDRHYSELKNAARQRLGSLYNPGDYPESLSEMFSIEFDFPSVERRSIFSNSTPSFTKRSAAGYSPVSTKRYGWQKRLLPPNWPSWSATLPNGSREAKTASRKRSALLPWRTSTSSSSGFASSTSAPASNSTAWWRMPSGSFAVSIRRTCATMPDCGSTLPPRCRGSRVCSMACSLIVRGGTSCVVPVDECCHEDRHRTWRGCPGHLLAKPSTSRHWAAPSSLGHRTSNPTKHGLWWADMSPVGGPSLGPYRHRSEALAAEVEWLEDNFL